METPLHGFARCAPADADLIGALAVLVLQHSPAENSTYCRRCCTKVMIGWNGRYIALECCSVSSYPPAVLLCGDIHLRSDLVAD